MLRRLYIVFVMMAICCAQAYAEEFNSDALRNLIIQKNLHSIEELLPYLPLSYRSHYVLMFRSRSLQEASESNPRAILYGQNAKFIISFNGNTLQKGFSSLETMEFDVETNAFRFREISFPDESNKNTPVHFSDPNPPKCLQCHGNPTRPVWDTHPFWPGAYGEHYNARLTEQEADGLQAFLAAQANHPRYKYLLNMQRFAKAETFRPTAKSRYIGTVDEPPNAELSLLLNQLNFQYISNNVVRHADFDTFKYALLGALSPGCGTIDEFYPTDDQTDIQHRHSEFSSITEQANRKQAELKTLRTAVHGSPDVVNMDDALLDFRFIAEIGLNLPTSGWTLALEHGTYDFTTPTVAQLDMKYALQHAMPNKDQHLIDLESAQDFSYSGKYCNYLRRQSKNFWLIMCFKVLPEQQRNERG